MRDESKLEKHAIRRRQILGATLKLLRSHGADITTAQIAAKAHCSKETLYNWFGDRDGIMMALVEEQAQSMGGLLQASFGQVSGSLEERLVQFSTSLLDMMTGDALITVNRVAMAQACQERADLGNKVLEDWRAQVMQPFIALFDEGNQSGALAVHSAEEAFENLIGLLVGDRQRRLLLGQQARPDVSAMEAIAAKAVQRWLILYRR